MISVIRIRYECMIFNILNTCNILFLVSPYAFIYSNKTKYFCSDSMMKYSLREGLERAKRELRES